MEPVEPVQPDPDQPDDMGTLAGWLRAVAIGLVFVAILGAVIDGLVRGLTFAVLARWVGLYLAGWLVASAVVVAVHAGRRAGAAQRRGERLSGDDVGLIPPRRRRG
jgi:hypothetical protein